MVRKKKDFEGLIPFIASVGSTTQLWRLLAGLFLIASANMAAVALLMVAVSALSSQAEMRLLVTGTTPGYLVLLLLSFGSISLACFAVVRVLHKRPAGTLFGHALRLNRRHAEIGVLVAILVALIPILIELVLGVLSSTDIPLPELNLPLMRWLGWLPLGLLGVLVQTSSEELVFRGYLLQQLAARWKSPWVWAGVPSVLFGFLHYNPATFGSNAFLVIFVTGFSGWIAAMVTAHTGNLGAAIGLHFGNNLLALLFIGIPGQFDGMSLFIATDFDPAGPEMAMSLRLQAVVLLIAYFLWRRWVSKA